MIVPDPRPDAAPDFLDLTTQEQHARLGEVAMQVYGHEMPIVNGIECPFCEEDHPLLVEDADKTFMPDRMEFLVYCPEASENGWVRWGDDPL